MEEGVEEVDSEEIGERLSSVVSSVEDSLMGDALSEEGDWLSSAEVELFVSLSDWLGESEELGLPPQPRRNADKIRVANNFLLISFYPRESDAFGEGLLGAEEEDDRRRQGDHAGSQ